MYLSPKYIAKAASALALQYLLSFDKFELLPETLVQLDWHAVKKIRIKITNLFFILNYNKFGTEF